MEDQLRRQQILEGTTVLDLTTFVTGGFATLMLANQGAEVIKIERPNIGDDNRYSGPPFIPTKEDDAGHAAADEGESPYFWTVNYDKRSVELDLKSEAGLETLYDLAVEADVFVENFRPGTAERLGVDYDRIKECNDSIVYCSISAFGETGPWSQRPGYDLLVQGMSGIMNVTGYPDAPPAKVGLPQTDLITGMWAGFGIVNALLRRERIGEGERIELGMLDAAIPWLTKQAGKIFADETPERMGTKDPVLAPYQTFPTADGHLNVACGNQRLWEELCKALDQPDLMDDERFTTNSRRVDHMDELEEELAAVFESRTTDEWVERLADEHGLPVGPVFDVGEALSNEQVDARGVVDSVSSPAVGEIPVLEHPLNYEHSDAGFDDAPPLLGEDTQAVLQELGYDDERIETLRERGVIPSESEKPTERTRQD